MDAEGVVSVCELRPDMTSSTSEHSTAAITMETKVKNFPC